MSVILAGLSEVEGCLSLYVMFLSIGAWESSAYQKVGMTHGDTLSDLDSKELSISNLNVVLMPYAAYHGGV